MGYSINNESEDGELSTDSYLSNDGDSSGGSSNGGTVLKKGPWTPAEDAILFDYVKKHGEGNWNAIQKHSGLSRCGKSCRLRWANHLRPDLKKGAFTSEEERLIIELHAKMGNKWARMAAHLPGRTDNEIKNYWNTRIKRRQRAGLPLYPLEFCRQALPENQQSPNSPVICVQLAKSEGIDESWMLDEASREICNQSDYSRPDVILGSSWLGQNGSDSKQRDSATDFIASLLSDDSVSELNASVGSSASSWGGLSSCTWNNMPAVCQMSDHP